MGACAASAGAFATAGGADTPAQRADALRNANATLSARSHTALLDLYSLESKLQQAQARLSSLQAQVARIRAERASVKVRIGVAHQDLRISQRLLALRVHALYEQQATDPIAVVLGAQSLDEAITSLDDLNRTAQLNARVATDSLHAQTSLSRLSRTLAQQDATVSALEADAARTTATLSSARSARLRYLAGLSAQRRFNFSQIAQLESRARTSVAISQTLATQSALTGSPPAPPPDPAPDGSRTITVMATGYSLGGTTATGLPVGWGIVAVDPSVIPLGTHMTIPGYGEGVAADTGSAVRGAIIDLWFPTTTQALAWGRRLVTITLH